VIARFVLATLLAGAAVAACDRPAGSNREPVPRALVEDWKIEPGARIGALDRLGSASDLVRAYGSGNVRDSSIELGEGETARGSLLFPDDPQRRVEILWHDPENRRAVRRAVLRGERSRWMLPQRISLGSALTEVEAKNGRPFKLTGFAWDYAGAVTSWEGGALDSLLPGVRLYFEPRIEDRAAPAYGRLQGDREFGSDAPDMRALAPRVYQIFVDFEPHPDTPSPVKGRLEEPTGGR